MKMKDLEYKGVKFKAVGYSYRVNIRGFDHTLRNSRVLKKTARDSAKSYLDYVLREPPDRVFFSDTFIQNKGPYRRLRAKYRYWYWCRHYEQFKDKPK